MVCHEQLEKSVSKVMPRMVRTALKFMITNRPLQLIPRWCVLFFLDLYYFKPLAVFDVILFTSFQPFLLSAKFVILLATLLR